MTVIFGDKLEFAIEAMIEPELVVPSHVWGRMCFWVNGFSYGDIRNAHCGLYQCAKHLSKLQKNIDSLTLATTISYNDNELANFLYDSWLRPKTNDFGEQIYTEEYDKYRFDYGLAEMFDGQYMFFLYKLNAKQLKFLFRGNTSSEIGVGIFRITDFLVAVDLFLEWYEIQFVKLESKNA